MFMILKLQSQFIIRVRMHIPFAAGLLLLAACVCASAAQSSAGGPPPHSGIAATVNGEPITMADLKSQCMQAGGDQALQQLINETLIDQAASAKHIVVTQAAVKEKDLQ